MAKINVTEFPGIQASYTVGGSAQVPKNPVTTAPYDVAVTAGSVQGALFNGNTNVIRVQADAICAILIDTNPTALVTSTRMIAGQTEYIGVAYGQRIAVIATT